MTLNETSESVQTLPNPSSYPGFPADDPLSPLHKNPFKWVGLERQMGHETKLPIHLHI